MHGPAFSKVTGTAWPSARKTCDIPIFLPRIPGVICQILKFLTQRHKVTEKKPEFCSLCLCASVSRFSFAERLDLHIHARGQIELHQRVHSLLGRLQNVQQTL